ncbi:ubiquitin carboxyl-terminal hydrolase 47 [Thalassophryne amazonica]|uniref:ubiquitin carboxyl-terminal hydrolase 47 n=1 Tax=Thalassophryne amazonica TaxID=390379 RepID=UPI001470A4EA|nr:ubiquitin carboxyl-terminal hydrolase 47 [Thalassophryne amazonica]
MNRNTVEMLQHKLNGMKASDYHGLKSPGLTCYLNSILQVLFMTPEFRETVKSNEGQTSMDQHLRELFADLEKGAADTHRITKLLQIKDVYQQQDAAEFFQKILSVCSSEAAEIFKGELSYRFTCCGCNQQRNSRNHFYLLPLTVESWHHEPYSVSKGFEEFFRRDKVSRDNKMSCSWCRGKKDAIFQCQITQHPDILTLLLKRFSFDFETNRYVKVHCEADIPETLQTQDLTYNLYAVVMHSGSLSGGHYTACIKSFENGEWYDFNDTRVQRAALGNACRRSQAYLLMYKKASGQSERLGAREARGPSSRDLADRRERRAGRAEDRQEHVKHSGDTRRVSQTPATTSLKDDSQRITQRTPGGAVAGAKPRAHTKHHPEADFRMNDKLQQNHNTETIRGTTKMLIHPGSDSEARRTQQRAAGGRDATKDATRGRMRPEREAAAAATQQSHNTRDKSSTRKKEERKPWK